MKLFVGVTPVIPEGTNVLALIKTVPIGEVMGMIKAARRDKGSEIVSCCDNPAMAKFLEVESPQRKVGLEPGQTWTGIRPKIHGQMLESSEITPADFEGWTMKIFSSNATVLAKLNLARVNASVN